MTKTETIYVIVAVDIQYSNNKVRQKVLADLVADDSVLIRDCCGAYPEGAFKYNSKKIRQLRLPK